MKPTRFFTTTIFILTTLFLLSSFKNTTTENIKLSYDKQNKQLVVDLPHSMQFELIIVKEGQFILDEKIAQTKRHVVNTQNMRGAYVVYIENEEEDCKFVQKVIVE